MSYDRSPVTWGRSAAIPHPPLVHSVCPNLSHHKVRVQAVSWPPWPVNGAAGFCCPPPPPRGKGRPGRTEGRLPPPSSKASTSPGITGKTPPRDKCPEVQVYPAPFPSTVPVVEGLCIQPRIQEPPVRIPGAQVVLHLRPTPGSPSSLSSPLPGGAIRMLTPPPLFFYYGIHSLMVGRYQILRYLSW